MAKDVAHLIPEWNAKAGQAILDSLLAIARAPAQVAAQTGTALGAISAYTPGDENANKGLVDSLSSSFSQAYNKPVVQDSGGLANSAGLLNDLLKKAPQITSQQTTETPSKQEIVPSTPTQVVLPKDQQDGFQQGYMEGQKEYGKKKGFEDAMSGNAQAGNEAHGIASYSNEGQLQGASNPFSGGSVDQNFNVHQTGALRQVLGALLGTAEGAVLGTQVLGKAVAGTPTSDLVETQGKMLDNAMKLQKYRGQEPAQIGELQKQKLQSSQKYQEELSKPLTPEQSETMAALLEGVDATNIVSKMLLGNGGSTGLVAENAFTPAWFQSDQPRLYDVAISRAINAKQRASGGKALTPQEIKAEVQKYKPRPKDSPKVIRARIKPLMSFFDNSIQMADPYGIHQERAKAKDFAGSSLRGINQVLKARGVK